MLAPFAKLDAINGTLNRVMASKVTCALKGLKDFPHAGRVGKESGALLNGLRVLARCDQSSLALVKTHCVTAR